MNKQMLQPLSVLRAGAQISKGWEFKISLERSTCVTPGATGLPVFTPSHSETAHMWGPRLVPEARGQAGAVSPPPGHGHFPYLCGNLNDVIVSPLLYTCYRNSQSISRVYGQYGASTIQPISEEMQLLLTVYYLVQLGESPSHFVGTIGGIIAKGGNRTSLDR